jgi:BirA family biotin operon repressor/biotin-[acetyl-CoA-carboxylase] ligase
MSESNREPFDVTAAQSRTSDRWTVGVVAETGSTNADLLAGAAGTPDRTVLVAELQTGGRGRLARSWVSPARAGLTFSVLVRPGVTQAGWGWLPLLAGLALARSIGPDAGLKWPNDVLLGPDGAKVAGILVQSGPGGVDGFVVIGVGLNVSTTADELPVPTATSLYLQGYSQLDRPVLLAGFLTAFDELFDDWQAAGGDAEASGLAAAYRAGCSSIGREVTVQLAERNVQGEVTAVDPAGRLVLLESGSGDELVLAAGDVTHVRPISR